MNGFVLLIVSMIVIGVLFYATKRIIAVLPIDEPFKTVIQMVLLVAAVLWIVQIIFGFVPGWPVARWR